MEPVLREGAFRGETHIVIGAAHGIGNRVAAALATHGARVALVDLDPGWRRAYAICSSVYRFLFMASLPLRVKDHENKISSS